MEAVTAERPQIADDLAELFARLIAIRDARKILLTPAEAAEALGISERKLWDLMHAKEIPCVRIGELVRYRPEALEAFALSKEGRGPGERVRRVKNEPARKRSQQQAESADVS